MGLRWNCLMSKVVIVDDAIIAITKLRREAHQLREQLLEV